MRRRRAMITLITLVATLAFLSTLVPAALEDSWAWYQSRTQATVMHQDGTSAEVLAALDGLEVRPSVSHEGYARDQFGNGWGIINGCSTRSVILYRDLKEVQIGDECTVQSGVLDDPYTGKRISFSSQRPSTVQIDHIVALSDAWQKGAQSLTADQRKQLANDPIELIAVDGVSNQAKGDGDAAEWLPPNRAFHCSYIQRQIAVKKKYRLWVSQDEKRTMLQVLSGC